MNFCRVDAPVPGEGRRLYSNPPALRNQSCSRTARSKSFFAALVTSRAVRWKTEGSPFGRSVIRARSEAGGAAASRSAALSMRGESAVAL